MSTGMAGDTAHVSSWSWGPFIGCCTRHGSHGRSMRRCMLVDPLGAQVVSNQSSFHDAMEKMFWVTLVDNFQILIIFYFDIQI
jgi:hypothetical protein